MIKNKYDKILEQFERHHPYLYEQAVDWWASGRLCITVRLEDNTAFEFDSVENTIRRVRLDKQAFDDSVMSKEFGTNLQKFISFSGMSQSDVAKELGITNAMLSRYIHGTSMPSVGKAFRLANILGCTIDELFDSTYID